MHVKIFLIFTLFTLDVAIQPIATAWCVASYKKCHFSYEQL